MKTMKRSEGKQMAVIGEKIKISIFGESHGNGIGVVIDAPPAGYDIDLDEITVQMARRSPGDPTYGTARKEADIPEIISGVSFGKTNGFPLCAVIRNTNARSSDYADIKPVPRPGHADYTAYIKYHGAADMSGGGHFSGRLTAPLVFAGAVIRQILSCHGITVGAHVSSMKDICDTEFNAVSPDIDLLNTLNKQPFAVIDSGKKEMMLDLMQKCRDDLDSVGGSVEAAAVGVPAGLGGPLFNGLDGKISGYVFGIPAVKAIEFGKGVESSLLFGSENNDEFTIDDNKIITKTNNCGGILGGISNGMPIIFKTTFKPTPSIAKKQNSVDIINKCDTTLEIKGRHDPCVVPRAVVCVESALCLAIADAMAQDGLLNGGK